MSSKTDTLLKKSTTFEKLALYSDRKKFLQALAQNNSSGFNPDTVHTYYDLDEFGNPKHEGIPQPEEGKPSPSPASTYTMPTVNITGKLPSIRKEQQGALNKIITNENLGNPIKTDGILGPETQQAINAFKKKFDPTNKYQLTNQKVLDWAEMLAG
jgi:peptidoglycan hydrolase-like protein with peptidoglycan-binding domain